MSFACLSSSSVMLSTYMSQKLYSIQRTRHTDHSAAQGQLDPTSPAQPCTINNNIPISNACHSL